MKVLCPHCSSNTYDFGIYKGHGVIKCLHCDAEFLWKLPEAQAPNAPQSPFTSALLSLSTFLLAIAAVLLILLGIANSGHLFGGTP